MTGRGIDRQHPYLPDFFTKVFLPMRNLLRIIFFLVISTGFTFGQTASKKSLLDFLYSEEVVEVDFQADFSKMKSDKQTEAYSEGSILFQVGKGRKLSLPVKVRPRGKYRRMICDFPPLKLKFPKKELVAIGLDTFNNMKLVTHCIEGEEATDEFILKEYLAYKLFNRMTANSLRVQLVKINYINTSDESQNTTRYGFLLEDDDEAAARLGGEVCDCYNPPAENIDQYQAGMVAMFQYMVGNADWDQKMLRNIIYIKPHRSKEMIMLPYDFDFSGMVSPPYIKHAAFKGQTNIKQRLFMGEQQPEEQAKKLKDIYILKKEELFNACENFPWLSRKAKKETIKYLDTFYEELSSAALFPKEAGSGLGLGK